MDNTGEFISNFSDTEQQILALYDQLEQLRLECSLIEAQDTAVFNDGVEDVNEDSLNAAQSDLLESQALYSLRNNILESIFIADPILKAVHSGSKASPVVRDLRPHIRQRDELSISLTNLSSTLAKSREDMIKLESENIILARKNAELTKTMLQLAEEASAETKEDIKDPGKKAEIEELEESLRVSRQRWKIMKGTTSGVVAGSGVNWANDSTLRKLVLDVDDLDVDDVN